jgi:hypothetical protein
MRQTLEMINRMQADGIIDRYAIGGAVGATFYLEPAATLDVDIFVVLPNVAGSSLVTLSSIYEYLSAQGCVTEHEHVIIKGWPVQFLPVGDALEQEALQEATQVEVDGVNTWVMKPEHLVALALRTGRTKDHARVLQFLETAAVDRERLQDLVARHGLGPQWHRFQRKFLEE